MTSLYVGRVGVCPVHHHSVKGKKKKKSSVHIVTTSYTAEVVSQLPKPQPQLQKTKTKKTNTPKYHVRLGYNDLAKK